MNENNPNPAVEQEAVPPPFPPGGYPPTHSAAPPPPFTPPPQVVTAPPVKKEKRAYSTRERVLFFLSLGIGLCYDRLVFTHLDLFGYDSYYFSAIFWLVYLAVFYAYHWRQIAKSKVLWFVAGCSAALCVWPLFFDYNSAFGGCSAFVIPCVLMAHAQFATGKYSLEQPLAIALEWMAGWVIKPFSALPLFFGAIGSFGEKGRSPAVKRVLLGVCISLPLLLVVVPLLAGADMVFGYYLNNLFKDFRLASFAGHTIVAVLASMFFFSFLWNIRFGKPVQATASKARFLDPYIFCGILGMLSAVYAVFCAFQFTYLFARAGLPDNMTYSEYAREGFWQLITIAAINLLVFGVILHCSKESRVVRGFLYLLLAMTAVMLVSGMLRLHLYISVYGLTWKRLLSAWFLLYLAAVLILCAVRLSAHKIPLVSVCAFLLLGWFTVLGYCNPDGLVVRYNLTQSEVQQTWVEKNSAMLKYSSGNAITALISFYEGDWQVLYPIVLAHYESGDEGYSYSNWRAREQTAAYVEQYRDDWESLLQLTPADPDNSIFTGEDGVYRKYQ